MSWKPNYSLERRRRELAKAEKKAARLEARAKRRERHAEERPLGESDGQDGDGSQAPEEAPPRG